MPRPAKPELPALEAILDVGPTAPSLEEKLAYLTTLRRIDPAESPRIDEFLVTHIAQARDGLVQAREAQQEMGELLHRLTTPPWYTAIFASAVATPNGLRAIVLQAGTQRVVDLNDGVELQTLQPGDEVFLANALNVIMAASPRGKRFVGETATFDRKLDNGQWVLKSRDEELIVDATPALDSTALASGDLVRFDRTLWMGFEKVERFNGHSCLLEEVPHMERQQLGGLDGQIDTLFSALTIALAEPELAKRYGLRGRQSILMIGPPGVGKTLLAKAVASEITRISGRKVRIAVVKPGEFESPWVGQTQINIRNFFKTLRAEADNGMVVCFFDEIEAVGRTRGSAVGHHADQFLAAFLAELDGFVDRKSIAIISATNRKDLVDPALLERLSDVEIPVGRPNLNGARAIFGIHLPPALSFSPNGAQAQTTRDQLIHSAVSHLYSPNADAGNEICVIRFADGKERTVVARELISGRIIEQICRQACRTACVRESLGEGEPGIRQADVDDAVAQALARMRTSLTIHNIHSYLVDLPQDRAVVSVLPITRKVSQPRQYLNA